MQKRKWIPLALAGLFSTLGVFGDSFATREVFNEKKKEKYLQVENETFQLNFFPFGGRLMSFYFKPGKMQLTDPDTIGTCTENIWNVNKSRFFLREKPFLMKTSETQEAFTVEAVGNHKGGGIDFLRVAKKYVLPKDASLLRIEYDFENLPDAMARMNYAILLHNNLGIPDEPGAYFYPTTGGIQKIQPDKRPLDIWFHRPARGWIGMAAPSGRGMAVTMSYPELMAFYSWFSKDIVPTVEWRMVSLGIDAGKSYKTGVEMIPFTGLPAVSGAGGGLVGAILPARDNPEEGETVPVEVRVYNARRGTVDAELRMRVLPGGTWKKIAEAPLVFDAKGSLKSFRTNITCSGEGLAELEVILRTGGKEAARLNAAVNFGDSEEKWTIDPLEKKLQSAVKAPDLSVFNHVEKTPHIAWAKPLSAGRIKVLVLTHFNNIPEAAQLAQRLDMDFTAPYLVMDIGKKRKLDNPIYGLGEYFGLLTGTDMEDNLKKALAGKYDAILLGGLPWEMFPEFARQEILRQVKDGAGLVFAGPENGADFLALQGKNPKTVRAVPESVKKSPVTDGIPFELLGDEPVYQYVSTGDVLAVAGKHPYLTEYAYGKGKVLALTYRATFGRFNTSAGLTPNLLSFYPDRADAHEFYYSLLAKSLLHAARKPLPISFGKAEFTNGKAVFPVTAGQGDETEWECFVMDRFMTVRLSEKHKIVLRPGGNRVEFPLSLTPYAGKQSVSIIVRNRKGEVLNWGSWSVEKNPDARIASLKCARDHYDNGDEVSFTAEIPGNNAGKRLKFELIDSFGRILDRKELPAAAKVSASLKIDNPLPSRSASVCVILSGADGREIDRRYDFIAVRPSASALVWDDFEPGTWMTDDGVRPYLWKEQARILNRIQMRTLISNWEPLAVDFPVRYNFHPTLLEGVGLGQCSQPPEYARTGNKMLLVRKPCLSHPEFIRKTEKNFHASAEKMKRYSLRFFWLGDEQSITGYGGLPVDFCFSQDCLKEFRLFLKDRYGTLAKLNEAWEKNYASWDEVLPSTKEEIWNADGRSVASWADHLEFMDGRLENIVGLAGKAAHEVDPSILISISGTQAPTAYGGMDWWKQMKVFGSLMNYYVGGQEELLRSFAPDAKFMPWEMGYSRKGAVAVSSLWNVAFLGSRGVMGFAYRSMVNPDWTLPSCTKDTLPHLTRLAEGVGKHLIHNLKSSPEIAVLYSQASIRAAFIENRRDEHRDLRLKNIRLLRNMGVDFRFISYEQLADGILEKTPCKLLILPDSTALSDAEIEAVRKFAAKGGKLFAEGMPGRREGNCRLRKESPLKPLFASPGNFLTEKIDNSYLDALNYPESPENAGKIEAEQLRMEDRLKKAEVSAPQLVILDENGRKIRSAVIYPRADASGNLFFGVLTANQAQRQATFRFPVKAHVFNLVNGQYYGETDRLNLPLHQGTPYAFMLLKEQPGRPQLTVKGQEVEVRFPSPLDTIAWVRIFRPDGTEAVPYAVNLPISKGIGRMKIPFALSDPPGSWKVTVREIISGKEESVPFTR